MKIAMISYDDEMGGAAVAAKRLAKSLIKRGHAVDLLVLSKGGNEEFVKPIYPYNKFQAVLKLLYFSLERLYFYFFEKEKAIRFAFSPSIVGRRISRNVDLSKYDVIHFHWFNFGMLTISEFERILRLNKPTVWTMHDMWAITGGCHHSGDCLNYQSNCGNCHAYLKKPSDTDLSRTQALKKQKVLAGKSNLHLVACSNWLEKRAQLSSIVKGTAISAIPNPIDIDLFKPTSKEFAKRKLNLDPSKKHILFVAMKTSVIWKGFSYMVQALELIAKGKDCQNYEVIILGNHDLSTTAHLGLKIYALGLVRDTNDIVNVYNAADVFVSSSLQENLPNTIMEAMACNVPVVGFSVGGIPEMVDHLKTGYLAKNKSSLDLAKGIEYVLQNAGTFDQYPRTTVVDNYSENIVSEQYEKVYQSF